MDNPVRRLVLILLVLPDSSGAASTAVTGAIMLPAVIVT